MPDPEKTIAENALALAESAKAWAIFIAALNAANPKHPGALALGSIAGMLHYVASSAAAVAALRR